MCSSLARVQLMATKDHLALWLRVEFSPQEIHEVKKFLEHWKSSLLELQNLFQYIKFPPVGLGVLRWVEYITTPKYLEKQIEGTPLSLALIDEIAICHPQLHNDVMKLLTKLLENNFPAMDTLILLNLKKNVLGSGLRVAKSRIIFQWKIMVTNPNTYKTIQDRMVHLISRGYVIPILRYIQI